MSASCCEVVVVYCHVMTPVRVRQYFDIDMMRVDLDVFRCFLVLKATLHISHRIFGKFKAVPVDKSNEQ